MQKRSVGIAAQLAARSVGQPSARSFGDEEADRMPTPAPDEAPQAAAPTSVSEAAAVAPPTASAPIAHAVVNAPVARKEPPKRSNRTFRASDEEFAIISRLRRTLYLDGRCADMADTSDILRSALRLAATVPIDALVDDILAHRDEA